MNEFVSKVAAELADDILEIQKYRSDVQLDAFVVDQHDTTPRKWQQTVLEIQIALFALREVDVRLRQSARKIKKLRNGTEEEKEEGELLMIGREQTLLAVKGKLDELAALYRRYKSMPRFTREQIEKAEPEYWKENRIPRQALHGLISRATGIPIGDLDAAVQLGIPLEEFVQGIIEEARPCLELMHRAILGQSSNSGTLPAPSPVTLPPDAKT